MLIFLGKLLYLTLTVIAYPINFIRICLYNYIANKIYRDMIDHAKKTFGSKGFDDIYKK